MSRLGNEFGITDHRLAKICDQLEALSPPRGYWAKKEARKPVVTFKLPARSDGIPDADTMRQSTGTSENFARSRRIGSMAGHAR